MERKNVQRKIGILGGTFDPVHKGHLAVARSALERYDLDQVLFIPAFSPPHKDTELTPFAHRLAMLEICLADDDKMTVSTLEAERDEPSYTVETLHELHKRIPDCTFYLIVGADMFAEIELWYRYRDLFELAHFLVVARPGIPYERIIEQVSRLPVNFNYDREQLKWSRADGCTISYFPDIAETISSSRIREYLKQGKPVDEYLDKSVMDYIRQHALYKKFV